ncbi:hypothetical protein PGB90_004514 [Kerria lacca]
MALKKWMKKYQPLSLYIVLFLTTIYFLLQLVVSYITHALTLTIDSYLTLCNLIALFGYIITLKHNADDAADNCSSTISNAENSSKSDTSETSFKVHCVNCSDQKTTLNLSKQKASEKRLKNTFGWARIDVLVMLIGCVVFSALCFSNVIEAVQTLLHISHHDEMHYPIPVFCVGLIGLVLNGLCYLLIGGYTFHRSSCLKITSSGVVILDDMLNTNKERKLNLRSQCSNNKYSLGFQEMFRDIIGCIFVMIGALFVYYGKEDVAKLADPIFSVISAFCLVGLSFPYIKESGYILLQTIPNHINIDSLCNKLMKEFPEILNIHDLHVWQFTKDKTFLTAHIIFINPQVYTKMKTKITNSFYEQGISVVTVQPEFFEDSNKIEMISSINSNCLIKCFSRNCYQRYCCDLIDPVELESVCISKLKNNVDQNQFSNNLSENTLHIKNEFISNNENKATECSQTLSMIQLTKIENINSLPLEYVTNSTSNENKNDHETHEDS